MKEAIRIENLSKKYIRGSNNKSTFRESLNSIFQVRRRKDEFWALKDINLSVNKGEILGIIGNNGAGKSTLLKILSKITYPSSGKVIMNGRVASLLEVGTGFHPELTGLENIHLNGALLGMSKSEIKKNFEEIVEFSGVGHFINTPVKHYSSGMYLRLAFAVAAHLSNDILLVDEVLAVGDANFRRKCLGKMNDVVDSGRTVLFVSHDLPSLQALCPNSILMNNGQIVQRGETQSIVSDYLSFSGVVLSKIYEEGPLKSVRLEISTEIKLIASYDFDCEIIIPHLGFVIWNEQGLPVFGTNPTWSNVNIKRKYKRAGEVEVVIHRPVLNKGRYKLGVWLGKGYQRNDFSDPDALVFEISTSGNTGVGVVKGNVTYTFR